MKTYKYNKMENNLDPNNDLTTIVFEPANVIRLITPLTKKSPL